MSQACIVRSMRRIAVLAMCLASLVVVGSAQALDRATSDRPDEAVGPQFHVVYAVPADVPDQALDTNGTIANWVMGFNSWMAGQTGGVTIRIDTFQGQPDISFIRLAETDAVLAAESSNANYTIDGELASAGLAEPDKHYLVFEQGGNAGACGWGGGPLAVVYLEAVPGGVTCAYVSWAIAAGHEMFHTLGAVASCAPHFTNGHVTDPTDLMYPYLQSSPLLDPGHDDYYGPPGDNHLPATCPESANTANSDFLTSHPFDRLSIAIAGGGSVLVDPLQNGCTTASCEFDVPQGDPLTLSTAPDAGFHFAAWNGGGCAGTGPCTLTPTGDTAVNATFAPNPYLTVRIKGKGRVVIPDLAVTCTKALCRPQFTWNEKTGVRAVAAKGSHFAGWSGACRGVKPVCGIRTTTNVAVTAVFKTNAR